MVKTHVYMEGGTWISSDQSLLLRQNDRNNMTFVLIQPLQLTFKKT